MTGSKLAVVSAGLSEPSSSRLLADRLEEATLRVLNGSDAGASSTVIELRDHAHEVTNSLLTGFPGGPLRDAVRSVSEADGLIAVTPIFNASYSGLFKSFFDILEADSLRGKPVLIAAAGGTARHSLALEHALRPLFAYLRCVVVPTSVFAAPEDWGGGAVEGRALIDRIDQAARELAALMSGRALEPVVDGFDDPTPFERLLGG